MDTTGSGTISAGGGQVIPLRAVRRRRAGGGHGTREELARLLPRVRAGDGAAMVEALEAAGRWWDAYTPCLDARGGGEDALAACEPLLEAAHALRVAVALAPAPDAAAVLAKARLLVFMADEGSDWGDTGGDATRTLLAGLEMLLDARGGDRGDA